MAFLAVTQIIGKEKKRHTEKRERKREKEREKGGRTSWLQWKYLIRDQLEG